MGFDPRLYRLLHRGTPGDVAFYRRLCDGASSVLELGCGDGRVAIPLASDGLSVVGLEQSGGMLAAAREARDALAPDVAGRLTLEAGDMACFELDRRFDRIVIPYTAFYCLDPDTRQGCLRRVARHLTPGGLFAFDVYPGDPLREIGPFFDETPVWIDGLRDGDDAIEVFERDDHRAGRIDVTYIHQIARPGAMPTRESYTLTHYYLCVDEVAPTLAEAGLELVSMHADFEGAPVDPDADRLVVVAARAEGRR